MSDVLIREGTEGDLRHRDAGEKAMERQRQRLSCADTSQGTRSMPRIAGRSQNPGERHRMDPPSESPKGTEVDANKFLWNA